MGREPGDDTAATRWVWEELRQEVASAGLDPAQTAAQEAQRLAEEQESARARAYAQGRERGLAEAHEELMNSVKMVNDALDVVRSAGDAWQANLEANMVALSTAIARQIVGRELRDDPDSFADLVRTALTKFPLENAVKIRVNPADLSAISKISQRLGSAIHIEGTRETQWIADPDILPGGCIVDGPETVVDGRIDTTLERIFRVLTDA